MSLSITTPKPQLQIKTTSSRLSIQQPKGEFSITRTNPEISIDRQLPRVLIDQSRAFSEAGLKRWWELMDEYAKLGKMQALNAIARIVDDGNRMAQIQNKMPPAIPELALKNSTTPPFEVNFDIVPKSRPKIEVEGHLNIDWKLGELKISYTLREPIIEYTPSVVDISV